MQEQQRFVNFIIASMLILWVWSVLIAPQLFPAKPKPAPVDVAKKVGETADPKNPNNQNANKAAPGGKAEKDQKVGKLHEFPKRDDVEIGSSAVDSGYKMLVKFHSQGATVAQIQLIDPRYHDLDQPKQPLSLIRPDPLVAHQTLETDIPEVDAELKKFGTSLKDVNWEVVKGKQNQSSVTWRYLTPDNSLEILKEFSLDKAAGSKPDQESKAYCLRFKLTLNNLDKHSKPKLQYVMYGPVGLPVENRYYTQKTRDIALGFLSPTGALTPKLITSVTLQSNLDKQREEVWRTAIKYAGVDLQYFTVLLIPQADQNKTPYFSSAKAIFVDPPPKDLKADTKFRHATLELTSTDMDLAAKGAAGESSSVSQEFVLYAGPKRPELLRQVGAEQIVDYGVSGRLGVPQLLLYLLSVFQHGLSFMPWPYGWSIILLTIVVRSCMFPLSRKQAIAAAKMQELQPEIAALKEKYKKEPEKFAKAQMDLLSKNNCNPLGGCLPALIQLPIFFGLYQAFNISVEMRGAPFLWIDNLAAPDALFAFGMVLPFGLGPSFNLLPILTVCLFLVQQKILMPPATTPEAEMQQKVFFYMTIFMGYMFYSVAAGMCVYFIASSLWGLAERKLLPKKQLAQTTASSEKNGKITVDLLPKPGSR